MAEVLPSLSRGNSASNILLGGGNGDRPPTTNTAGSFSPYDALGELMDEITRTLERTMKEREAVGGNMERALLNFSRQDEAISAELAELPGDLDAYLRLVRDKRRMEARKHEEAQETDQHVKSQTRMGYVLGLRHSSRSRSASTRRGART